MIIKHETKLVEIKINVDFNFLIFTFRENKYFFF